MKLKPIAFCAFAVLTVVSCGSGSKESASKNKILTINFGCAKSIKQAAVYSVDRINGKWGESKISDGEKCSIAPSPQNNAILMNTNGEPIVQWTMRRKGGQVSIKVP